MDIAFQARSHYECSVSVLSCLGLNPLNSMDSAEYAN